MNLTDDKVDVLQKKVSASPGAPGFARLADHYRSRGQLDQAIAVCEKGIQNNPGYPTGHLLLGRCLYEKNRIEEARAAFESVLKLDRKNIFALKIMGDILVQSRRMEEAAGFYKRACDCDPLNPELLDLFGRHRQYLPQKQGETLQAVPAAPAPPPRETPPPPSAAAPPEWVDLPPGAGGVEEIIAPKPRPKEGPAAALVVKSEGPALSDTSIIEVVESAEGLLAGLPGDAPAGGPVLMPDFIEAKAPEPPPSAPPPSPPLARPAPEGGPAVVAEMVDLPAAMTGFSEEKVGDFGVRKSLYERLRAEETDLVEAAFERRTPVAEQILDEVPAAAPLPAPESALPEEAAAPAVSAAAPGMDGFYSVDGGMAGESAGAMLEGIDQIELAETIAEEAPAAGVPPAAPPVALAEGVDAEAGLQSLVAEIVDTGLLASSTLGQGGMPAAEAAAAPPPAAEPRPPAAPSFSAAAAGADGFYSVTGGTAEELGTAENLLADIDQVDLDAPIAEEDLMAPEAAPSAETAPPPATGEKEVAVDLGNDVAFEVPVLNSAAAPPAVPAPRVFPLAPAAAAGETATIKVVGHVATASLAELYFKQGHRREALAVYKKLLALHPGDAKITQKILAIEKDLKNG